MTRIVNSNHMKYRCPKCGGQEHRTDIDEFEATVFTCSSCGDKLNVVSPLFFGEGHDCIMGYAVIEVTDNRNSRSKCTISAMILALWHSH